MHNCTKAAQHRTKIISGKKYTLVIRITTNKKTSMSEKIIRTRSNLAGRGSNKRCVPKSALKEPPHPKNANTIRPRGNPTPVNRSKKQQRSTNNKQSFKNGQNHTTEDTGIQQRENNKTISPATIGLYGSNGNSSDSDSNSEEESLTTPKLVDCEVRKRYKTSINSNLTDNKINGEEFHSANTGHLVKLLDDLMKEVKITGTTRVNEHNSPNNVTENNSTRTNTESTPNIEKYKNKYHK